MSLWTSAGAGPLDVDWPEALVEENRVEETHFYRDICIYWEFIVRRWVHTYNMGPVDWKDNVRASHDRGKESISAACLPGAYADENNRKERKSRHLQRMIKSRLLWRPKKYNTGIADSHTHTHCSIQSVCFQICANSYGLHMVTCPQIFNLTQISNPKLNC